MIDNMYSILVICALALTGLSGAILTVVAVLIIILWYFYRQNKQKMIIRSGEIGRGEPIYDDMIEEPKYDTVEMSNIINNDYAKNISDINDPTIQLSAEEVHIYY
jgi:hypothetical protein